MGAGDALFLAVAALAFGVVVTTLTGGSSVAACWASEGALESPSAESAAMGQTCVAINGRDEARCLRNEDMRRNPN
jgi:Flp pilus assembly protein protease CpaA